MLNGLETISFSNEEVDSPWQSWNIAYKILPSNIKKVEDITPELKDILNPNNYIYCLYNRIYVKKNEQDDDNDVHLKGYATIGRKIKKSRKVEISADLGKTWIMNKNISGTLRNKSAMVFLDYPTLPYNPG